MQTTPTLAAIGAAMLFSLTACNTLNIPTDHAKTADGFINTSTYDLGHVIVWDTQEGRIRQIYRVTPDQVPSARILRGPFLSEKSSSVSSDTKADVGGSQSVVKAFNADVSASVNAGVVRTTDVRIKNYNPREYQDPRYVLNSPELRTWREGLNDQWADPRYRFVFISRVTDGDEISLTFKRSAGVDANANLVKVGEYKFKVQYDGSAGATIQAKNGPLVVEPSVYSFRSDRSKDPAEYRFYDALDRDFSFQRVKKA